MRRRTTSWTIFTTAPTPSCRAVAQPRLSQNAESSWCRSRSVGLAGWPKSLSDTEQPSARSGHCGWKRGFWDSFRTVHQVTGGAAEYDQYATVAVRTCCANETSADESLRSWHHRMSVAALGGSAVRSTDLPMTRRWSGWTKWTDPDSRTSSDRVSPLPPHCEPSQLVWLCAPERTEAGGVQKPHITFGVHQKKASRGHH